MTTERISTGNAALDEVLMGGFPRYSLNVVMGAPGTGKTILMEQMAFAVATPERPALFLTTLFEPLDKFIAHGQSYEFFAADKVGVSIFYEDLGLMLRERGLAALPTVITELIAAHRPALIIIDSFKALGQLHATEADRRQALFDLASVLAAYECTSFLVGEYAGEALTNLAEFAVADGVLQLIKQQQDAREQRFLRVEKLRGSGFVPGLHAFTISNTGLDIFPRLLTPTVAPDYALQVERLNTGITGLDEMIEQGFWRGSTTLLAGPTGSGKTVIGLHFIREGVRVGEEGIYVGFQENPTQFARTIRNFGWDAQQLLGAGGGFEHLYRSPIEMQLDDVVIDLFRRVRQGKIKRVVIDALGDLERRSMDRDRFVDYLYALTQWFAVEGVTALLLLELTDLFEFTRISREEVSNVSDNIILLRFTPDERMRRTIRIIKTRNSDHDHYERTLRITSSGVAVERAETPLAQGNGEKRRRKKE